MLMKKKYVRVIIFVFAILFSFVCVLYFFYQTKGRLKDTGRNLSIFSEVIDSNDIEQFLVSINDDTISRKTKMALLRDKVKNGWGNNPKILEKIFYEIKRCYVEQWLKETDSPAISGELQTRLYLFQEICKIVGGNGNPELVDLLLKESNIESWDKSFSVSNAKGMSVEYISDNFFRVYVFKGLLTAAVNKPELFEKIESYSIDYLRGTKTNVKDFLINSKEEYYRINPNKIPKEGYIKFTSQMKENPDFFNVLFLNLRIQNYVQKHRKLPSTILDLTIPKGGDYVYIPVDPNRVADNNFGSSNK